MPSQPAWIIDLPHILASIRTLPDGIVDRATLQGILGIGRRRAQQILAPCVSKRVGANGLAKREDVVRRLTDLAAGEDCAYEIRRREKFAKTLEGMRRERVSTPHVLVEAPTEIVNQEMADLPPGITLERGRIVVEFEEPQQALEKLLALAMAIGNEYEEFERRTG